jgi:hypothetical protein
MPKACCISSASVPPVSLIGPDIPWDGVPALRRSTLIHRRLALVVLSSVSEGRSSGEENANLYMRGVREGRAGEILDGAELLEILDVFGEDGLRSYIVGHLEDIDDAMEEEEG